MSETTTPKQKKVEPPFSGPLAGFEAWLYDIVYEKISYKLPKNVRDWIVKYGPWITLVVGIIMLPAVFAVFTISAAVTSIYAAYVGVHVGPMYYIAILALVVQLVLMFSAIAPLLKQRRLGWQLLFYSSTLSVAYSLLNSFTYGIGSLIGGLLGAFVSYYVIFQIREYYKS